MARRTRSGSPSLAVGYLRASTDDQALSPDAQRAAVTAWAERAGVTVVAWHTDAGVSGATTLDARPALVAALANLRSLGAGVLAVARRDRLARDVVVAAMIDRAVRACGARVASVDGVGNGDSPTEEFMRTILDGAAAYERALIRERTREALAVKKARGEFCGGQAPYGYRLAPSGELVPDVAELARVGIVSRAARSLALPQVARIVRAA